MQLELLQQHIKFHPDQLKNVRENEAKRFCFSLTLWLSAKVKVSENCINGRSLRLISNVFAKWIKRMVLQWLPCQAPSVYRVGAGTG